MAKRAVISQILDILKENITADVIVNAIAGQNVLPDGNFTDAANTTFVGTGSFSVANNVCTIDSGARYDYIYQAYTYEANKTYFAFARLKNRNGAQGRLAVRGSDGVYFITETSEVTQDVWQNVYGRGSQAGTGGSNPFARVQDIAVAFGDIDIKNFILLDLDALGLTDYDDADIATACEQFYMLSAGGGTGGGTGRKTYVMDGIQDDRSLNVSDNKNEVFWYNGYLYFRNASQIFKLDKSLNVIATSSSYSELCGMWVDADGVWITRYSSTSTLNRVYKLNLDTLVEELVSDDGTANWRNYSLTVATADHVYVITDVSPTGYVFDKATLTLQGSFTLTGCSAGDQCNGAIWNPRQGKLYLGMSTESSVNVIEPSVSLTANTQVSASTLGLTNYMSDGADDGQYMWSSGCSQVGYDTGSAYGIRRGDDTGDYIGIGQAGNYFNAIATHADSDYLAMLGGVAIPVGDDGGTGWTHVVQFVLGLHDKVNGNTYEVAMLNILALRDNAKSRKRIAMDDEGNVYIVGVFGYSANSSGSDTPKLVKYKLVDAVGNAQSTRM